MSLSSRVIQSVRSNRLGEAAFKVARNVVHRVRHLQHPDIPPDQQISTVTFRAKKLPFRHRRTLADRGVMEQCFDEAQLEMPNGPHAKAFQVLYEKIVAAGLTPLIVDCGANIGASVLWFVNRYPKAHVVAIEPAPDNFALLEHNTQGHDVDLRRAGLAATDGSAHLSNLDHEGWAYRTSAAGEGPAIEMISLANILSAKSPAKYMPFLLKIDIEGAESSLFDADTSAFDKFPAIIIEPHDWMLPGERSSLGFLRYQTAAGRELCIRGEHLVSFVWTPELRNPTPACASNFTAP
jgi:FkbM family methyltransferase